MNDIQALEMMKRCKSELELYRDQNRMLEPRAKAFECIAQILDMMKPSRGYREDLIYILDREIKNVMDKIEAAKTDGGE